MRPGHRVGPGTDIPVPAPRQPERADTRRIRSLDTLSRLADKLPGTDRHLSWTRTPPGKLLAVTPRTARRLLHVLVEEGLAWPLPPTGRRSPGRPRQFYRLRRGEARAPAPATELRERTGH